MTIKEAKQKTEDSLRKLDDHLFIQNYQIPYDIDDLLKLGISNTVDLASYVQTKTILPVATLKRKLKFKGSGFACTTFNAYKEDGSHILARNFDYKDGPALIYWTSPVNGYKSIAVTSMNVMLYGYKLQKAEESSKKRTYLAPYACMDGINEAGLSIAVLEIKTKATKQETGKKAIVTTVAIRGVLDKCATVEEAVEFFASYDMHDLLFCNYHYQITDATGKSVIIEYVNNEMRVIYPGKEKNQYLMNFYLSADGDNSKGFGYERRDVVVDALAKTGGVMDEQQAIDVLEKCLLNYKHERGYMITTLWSAAYNCNERSMTIAGGMDYSKIYKMYVDRPGEFEVIK